MGDVRHEAAFARLSRLQSEHLGLQVLGHAVEGPREDAELVLAGR